MNRERQRHRIMQSVLGESYFPPVTRVDMGALDRLSAFAAERRAEMGEERWAELQKEWPQ